MPDTLSNIQEFVHSSGCTLVLPGALLAVAAFVLAYRQATEDVDDLPLNGFLATILLQMLPLAALKAKIWMCTDRVSLVPMVLMKTVLMHTVLELLRVLSQALEGVIHSKLEMSWDLAMLLVGLYILRNVFSIQLTPAVFAQHTDVRNLTLLACGVALVSEVYFVYVQPAWMSNHTRMSTKGGLNCPKILFMAANYVDVVAFMPVVWRLYQAESALEDFAVGTVVSAETQHQVRIFFAFVGAFYLYDDVIDPIIGGLEEPTAMMAHAAHFMLLLDFAGFFTFQVTNTMVSAGHQMEKREQLQGLLSESFEDDA